MVHYKMAVSPEGAEGIFIIDGQTVRNGERDTNVFSSIEILADPMACAYPDEITHELRDEFDGVIV